MWPFKRKSKRASFTDNHVERIGQEGKLTPATLSQLPLSKIDSVVFYKRDQITSDLICCAVKVGGQVWTFHEEVEGWDPLLRHLEKLPGFRSDWRSAVALPPFASSETVAFKR